jgi:group I intron endonuclease
MQDNTDSGIYKIFCPTSQKTYIGLSKNIGKRKKHHFSQLKSNKHHNIHLQRHYNKYGDKSLIFEVVEFCDKSMLVEREIFYVAQYDSYHNGFNLSLGGEDNPMNHEKNRKAVSKALLGHKKSKEWIDKIIASRNNEKIFETKVANGSIKMVYAYNAASGELINKMYGYYAISKYFGVNESNVRQSVYGKMKTCKGIHFSLEFKTFDQVKIDVISKIHSDEYKSKMSKMNFGEGNPMWGKKRPEITGENNPMYKMKMKGTLIVKKKYDWEEILNLYKKGNTQNEISVITGAKQSTISNILRTNGIRKFTRAKKV